MKATYLGDGTTAPTVVFGRVFKVGESVDLSEMHPKHQAKIAANPAFTTDGEPDKPVKGKVYVMPQPGQILPEPVNQPGQQPSGAANAQAQADALAVANRPRVEQQP